MATDGSAACFAAKRPDHLHTEGRRWPPKGKKQVLQPKRPNHLLPEGRKWPPKGQQQVLWQRDQITYFLRAGDGHQRVSSLFCSIETRSLTS